VTSGAVLAADAGATEQESDGLESVVVTAQKREARVRDVPIPITAVSGESIRDQNVVLNTDIERLAPNLSAQGGGRTGKPRWFLRGIGTNDPNQTIEGPLGIYLDEVVIGLQRNQSFPLFDLERVEVLRGPQGTLWGKNNTGGAIHYISKKPTFERNGYAKVSFGNYDDRIVDAAGGGALIEDRLAVRASVYAETYDGWARNIVLDKEGPKLEDYNGRLQFLATPTEGFEAQLILGYRRVELDNNPSYTAGGTNAPGSAVTLPTQNGIITTGQTPAQIAAGGGYIPSYGNNPDVYSDYWGGEATSRDERKSATLKLSWDVGAGLNLASVSGFSDGNSSSLSLAGVPEDTTLPLVSSAGRDSFWQISQELRLSSPSDQDLSWIVGAYYYRLKANTFTRGARFNNGASQTVLTNRDQYTSSSWDQDSTSRALFANTKYRFLDDAAAVTLGVRYTREAKDMTETTLAVTDTPTNGGIVDFASRTAWYLPGAISGAGNFTPLEISQNHPWKRFTWDITPEYRFNKDLLAYARVATGFRSGGFNQSISQPAGGAAPFILQLSPEKLTDYEIGFKSTWLDERVAFDVAAFYYDLEDIQLNIQQKVLQADGTTQTSASGQSNGNVRGLEFELSARPVSKWYLASSLGLLRSRYTDFVYRVGSVTLDASGNEFYRTPRRSFRFNSDYRFDLGNSGKLVLGTDWSYRSHIFHNATVQNDPVQETPAYWIGNARATYYTPGGNLEFSGFVNNLTDENVAFLNQIVNANNVYPVSVGSPRTYGVQAIVHF